MGKKLQFTELDQYLFGQGTIMIFTGSWEHIQIRRTEKRGFILQCGHLMHRRFLL